MKKCVGVSCVWLNLEKKKRIKKIKVKKCVDVGCVAKCMEESREREKNKIKNKKLKLRNATIIFLQ